MSSPDFTVWPLVSKAGGNEATIHIHAEYDADDDALRSLAARKGSVPALMKKMWAE